MSERRNRVFQDSAVEYSLLKTHIEIYVSRGKYLNHTALEYSIFYMPYTCLTGQDIISITDLLVNFELTFQGEMSFHVI